MATGDRELPYEALDREWEAREFERFQAAAGARSQAPYGAYLFGRLMQSDLHQSCRPVLPPDVAKLNGSTIQGMCILQVVDVANIGASYEHRTEFSKAGPTRTLKLGLTDGHQLVFGFEFSALQQFSVNVPRGTKIVVENVPVRHGLLLLAPDNCQLLETLADQSTRKKGQGQQPADASGVNAGAYSAALVNAQFNSSHQQSPASSTHPQQPNARPLTAPSGIPQANAVRNAKRPPNPEPVRRVTTSVNAVNTSVSSNTSHNAIPSVFVDVPSSDEDVDSDTTDPMVEHLFYSPKTPRYPDSAKTMQSSSRDVPSRKRPRSPSMEQNQQPTPLSKPQSRQSLTGHPPVARSAGIAIASERTSSSTLLDRGRKSNEMTATPSPPAVRTQPFQYFRARQSTLSAPTQSTTTIRFQVRGCIKSVIGFQFDTGKYQLRVLVEDSTASREADVAEDFVTRLMGVPCSEFLQTMQTKVAVAHGWAANMQFSLMNLEGVMTFEKRATTPASASAPLLLVNCRDFRTLDARALLQRVKVSRTAHSKDHNPT